MDFKQLQTEHNLLFLCKFGSHLYGTNTKTSDTDYKGIYLPTFEDCVTGKINKSLRYDSNISNQKNTSSDIDCEIYSLQYFLELATQGQTVAIEMLHCNKKNTIITSPQFKQLQNIRSRFYTTDMSAFTGYVQKQAAKYGVKGSRLAAAKSLQQFLGLWEPDTRLFAIWDLIPNNTHTSKSSERDENGLHVINFCGKRLQETISVRYALGIVTTFIEKYGERAKQAEENQGVDWKAMSHALRVAYQLREIYMTKDLQFPLSRSKILKKIKSGQVDFKQVSEMLETNIKIVQELAQYSNFPATVDPTIAKSFLINVYSQNKGDKKCHIRKSLREMLHFFKQERA